MEKGAQMKYRDKISAMELTEISKEIRFALVNSKL